VLYAAFYAADGDDIFVGGDTQGGDCLGRRLARNMANDAENREIFNIPGGVLDIHDNTPPLLGHDLHDPAHDRRPPGAG
jgi:hypothetical protein